MDILDKLKYYQELPKSKSKTKGNSNLDDLAEHLNAKILAENSPPIIKRESFYMPEQISNKKMQLDSLYLPLLSKGQFSGPVNIDDLLFFDLETTGLAGGAGTYPFLLGFAFFENNRFKIIQYFLPEYDRDVFVYLDLKKIINSKSILVSYNGKSYDYPLLKTRFILNRFTNPFKNFQHLDLLHLSRRLWKNSLDNCSLQNIELEIFKFSRVGDIEGYLIPECYFSYLRTGEFDEIKNIVFHNEQDLISLVRLIFHFSCIENKTDSVSISGAEYLALAYTAIKGNNLELSKHYMNVITRKNILVPHKTQIEYSLLLKKNTIWAEAIEVWEKFLNEGKFVLFALEELAKYYEHQENEYQKAKEYVERALNYMVVLNELGTDSNLKIKKEEFEHRANRLTIKNNKSKLKKV